MSQSQYAAAAASGSSPRGARKEARSGREGAGRKMQIESVSRAAQARRTPGRPFAFVALSRLQLHVMHRVSWLPWGYAVVRAAHMRASPSVGKTRFAAPPRSFSSLSFGQNLLRLSDVYAGFMTVLAQHVQQLSAVEEVDWLAPRESVCVRSVI